MWERKLRLATLSEKILRLGVLASHGGTNLQAIIDGCNNGRLNAKVSVVISNNSRSMALQRAAHHGIPYKHLSGKTHPQPHELDTAILETLEGCQVDLVIMAGYMRKLGEKSLTRFRNRVLNSHPALLPKFGGEGMYGRFVHQAVLAAGETVTGVTIHLADDEFDHGPIVAQCEIPVREGDTVDTLTDRVIAREHEFWIETLQGIVSGNIDLDQVG